jgi:hypothetical protein
MDIFVDIALYRHDVEISERVKDAAGSLIEELSSAEQLPDVNSLAELCYPCGQAGSRNSLDGISPPIQREDAGRPIRSSFEQLRLRALLSLARRLAHFQCDFEVAP